MLYLPSLQFTYAGVLIAYRLVPQFALQLASNIHILSSCFISQLSQTTKHRSEVFSCLVVSLVCRFDHSAVVAITVAVPGAVAVHVGVAVAVVSGVAVVPQRAAVAAVGVAVARVAVAVVAVTVAGVGARGRDDRHQGCQKDQLWGGRKLILSFTVMNCAIVFRHWWNNWDIVKYLMNLKIN